MSGLSEHDAARVGEIMDGQGTNFSAYLIRLIAKADSQNRELLRQIYPDHVAAYERWLVS